MTIVFIASSVSIHSARWIKFFANNWKTKIVWITSSKPNNETNQEFSELKQKVKIYNTNNLRDSIRTIKFLLLGKYSLVHIHYLGWHSLWSLLIMPTRKLILTPWGSDLLVNKSGLKDFWLRLLFKKSDYVICDSQRLKNSSISLGADKNNFLISMFGIDTNLYKKKRAIFSKNKKLIIGSNRKLEIIYDVKTFIKAAEIICKKYKNIDFLIAGDGSLESPYKKYIKNANLEKRIIFRGLLNREQMLDFYNNVDIYISTSLSDGGLSSSIAEAMAFERVVIATNNSDNKLWIKNKKNGYLFKNSNDKELVRIIEEILNNKKENLLIASSARKIIEKKYSYEKEMDKVHSIYNLLYKSRKTNNF